MEIGSFVTVISNGSLHEWEHPIRAFHEISRVLRPGGRYCITDLRRDVHPLKQAMVYQSTQPKEMRPGLVTSPEITVELETRNGDIKAVR